MKLVLTVNNGGVITLAGVEPNPTISSSPYSPYSGGTVVNGGANGTGTVNLALNPIYAGDYLIPASGGLTINNATVTQTGITQQIDPTTNVTLNGSALLNLVGNNTLNNIVFKNDGGSPTNTQLALASTTGYMIGSVINSGGPATGVNLPYSSGVLTITGTITSTSSNVGTVSTLAGRIALGTNTTIDAEPIMFNNQNVAPLEASLAIQGIVNGQSSVISNISTGGLTVGQSVTGAGIPAGDTIASINGSTVILTIPATADSTGNTITFGGFITQTGNVNTTTSISGFTKTGAGVLQLNAPEVYTGGTTISLGMLNTGVQGAGSRFSQLNLAGASILNLAGFSTAWGSLTGSGTVFNSLASTATSGASTAVLTVGLDNTTTTFSGAFSRNNDGDSGGRLRDQGRHGHDVSHGHGESHLHIHDADGSQHHGAQRRPVREWIWHSCGHGHCLHRERDDDYAQPGADDRDHQRETVLFGNVTSLSAANTGALPGSASTGTLTVEQGSVVYGDPSTGAGTGGFQTMPCSRAALSRSITRTPISTIGSMVPSRTLRAAR